MRQFHSGKRDRSILERLEASHGRTPSLDRTLVLFDDVVEVLAGPNFHFAPDWMLSPQCTRTFACRLRAAGVSVEDRATLLGHADRSIAASENFAGYGVMT